MDIFSKRLKELREQHRYSQYDMAEKLGLSQSYYAKFELNKGEPNLETLIKIADLFEVSTDYLLGREEFSSKKVNRSEFDNLIERIEKLEDSFNLPKRK